MAFELVSLILAAATAAGAGGPVVYRNGVVTAVDPARRILAVDLPDGPTQLAAAEDVDLRALHPGESVLVGVQDIGGRSYAVRVRTAAAGSTARAAVPASLGGFEPLSPAAPRRPLYVIPEHEPGVPAKGLAPAPEAGAKVPAVSITSAEEPLVAEPPPPDPMRLERLRAQGEQDLVLGVATVAVLAETADQAWGLYVRAMCPTFGDDTPRAWLRLPTGASAPDGTCRQLLDGVQKAAARFRDRLQTVEDGARASSVSPGVVRKALAARGLQ